MRLARYYSPDGSLRTAATVREGCFALRPDFDLFEVAAGAADGRLLLEDEVRRALTGELVDIDRLNTEHRLSTPLAPPDLSRCLVTGTGLTHRRSADIRDAMATADGASDSSIMYKIGEQGGRPAPGEIGVAPEWFFKGSGHVLVPSGRPVEIEPWAQSTGEEAELAGVYLINSHGVPVRLGFVLANDLSDHRLEERNYLYLAPSKLRPCPIGPELLVGDCPGTIQGTIRIQRGGRAAWEQSFETGDDRMTHSIANLEHHHFKHRQFRTPGQLHIHLFGCPVFSYGDGELLGPGDEMIIHAPDFGAPLRTPLIASETEYEPVKPLSLRATKELTR